MFLSGSHLWQHYTGIYPMLVATSLPVEQSDNKFRRHPLSEYKM